MLLNVSMVESTCDKVRYSPIITTSFSREAQNFVLASIANSILFHTFIKEVV